MQQSILVILSTVLFSSIFISCNGNEQEDNTNIMVNWHMREVTEMPDSLIHGTSYLPVHSTIYSVTEHTTHNLTTTVSLRNINVNDSIYITKAVYYNTKGKSTRSYLEQPIFLSPLETVEIVIGQEDTTGGTAASFVFDWQIKPESNDPYFEATMISTSGQQGISFTTSGIKLK